jgi:cyclohexanecarboxylate-CoA ligase
MEFDAILISPRRATMINKGFWHDRTINDDLGTCLAESPDKIALTAVSLDAGTTKRFTYRELAAMADRIAVGLVRLGVRKNDVVSCQLPNWWQFTLTYLACSRIGAVMNPLMHIFRERELSFMLAHGESQVVIVPKTFRGFDYEQMLNGIRARLPALEHLLVVGGSGPNSFEARLTEPAWEREPDAQEILTRDRPGPDDITQLIYTSGTTGEPKGVMHTANTLMANIVPYAQRLHLSSEHVMLMASPMAHQTGFMYGLMMPVMLRASVVLQDIWEPKQAIDVIRAENVTFTMASTPFLTDLSKTVAESGTGVPSLQIFLCAGAPIPGPLVEQACAALGAKIVSAWGMSENGAVTTTRLEDADERSVNTDGCPLPGMEVRAVDGNGADVPIGEVGSLLVRGCSNFGGYLKRPEWNSTDVDDWFDTGDLARLDAEGYIRISGRSKDVIIRGGENIPVVEIESILYRHSAVAQVAIVAYADERLGERACAFVVTKPGQHFDLLTMVEFLKSHQMAIQYIPERLIVHEAMPVTPSGKVQKFKLREMVKELPA